jgi:hypothetical protein
VVTLLAASCGSTHKHAEPGASKLFVEQTVDRSGPLPIEGAYSYVRIEDRSGGKVTEQRVQSDKKAEISLNPGSYTLISYQRTCDGNCGTLDPASDSCSSAFTADGSLVARIRVTYGSGCTIAFMPAATGR